MRVKILDNEKIVLYLYNYFFKSKEKENITREIKKIFIRLIKYYNLNIGGIYEVLAFENLKYGTILEIEKKEELLFNPDLIDIKVKINHDVNFYFKTKEFSILENLKNIYYDNDFYYINIDGLENTDKVFEYGVIEYSLDIDYLNKKIFVRWYLFLNIHI